MANQNLSNAKNAKKDEFYTQYYDIEKEMNAYLDYNPDVFRGKTILLPCDDPEWSNFTKYFAQNFERYGLKKLISTSFASGSKKYKDGYQPSLFETNAPQYNSDKTKTHGKIFILDHDSTGDGKIDVNDLEWNYLEGDGDFRSKEVTALRDEADIIITNPPFSLFRVFLKWVIDSKKQFSIIGNINSVTCKEVFPAIKENSIWFGATIHSGDREFGIPDYYPLEAAGCRIDKKGNKYIRVKGVRWYTNIEHGHRHQTLSLMTFKDNMKFSKHKEIKGKGEYDTYDNYDAIDIPFTDAIPSDYTGIMGVPISFLDKFCPEQFEILGLTQIGCHDLVPDTRKYNSYYEVRTKDNSRTGVSGNKTNENAVILGKGDKKTYYINEQGRMVHSEYKRLLIRKRK
ncbi:UNVERIFIED_CONTAM: adenine-specific methyltransferase EcoRI family protein [Prevotella sp. 15_C9]